MCPLYTYRCQHKSRHIIERYFSINDHPDELICGIHQTKATRAIIHAPYIAVDNTDKVDYALTAGRNFSNKRERDEWLKANDAHIGDEGIVSGMVDRLNEQVELRREIEARGESFEEYLADKKRSEEQAIEDECKRLGVSVDFVDEKEAGRFEERGRTPAEDMVRLTETQAPGNTPGKAYKAEMPESFAPDVQSWDDVVPAEV